MSRIKSVATRAIALLAILSLIDGIRHIKFKRSRHLLPHLILPLILLFVGSFIPYKVNAVLGCYFQPVSTPLNDLGRNEYIRMDGTHTGYIGGLYLNGSNQRPPAHETQGVALANSIRPLNTSGQPDPNGKIGMISIGMSNNRQEFDTFRRLFDQTSDPLYRYVNPKLIVVSGSLGGGVLERWSDPTNSYYNYYWDNLANELALAGITHAQIQTVWIKTTEYDYLYTFPADIEQYSARLKNLVRIVKEKFPNIKIAYISSRTRAHWYTLGSLNPEPYSFETGFAVRKVITDQINGDRTLNYNPNLGPAVAPYLSWGPYLWIDGDNPRSDGKTWPVPYVSIYDCVHPETPAKEAVAGMLWDFFTTDTTAKPWFAATILTPTRTPTGSSTPTSVRTPTRTPTGLSTPTSVRTPTRTPTGSPARTSTPTNTQIPIQSPRPTTTPTVPVSSTPTPPPSRGLVSSFTFNNSSASSWDEIGNCEGCSNGGTARWDGSGWFTFSNSQTSYLNLGTYPYLNNRSAFTLSIWLKPNFDQTLNAFSYAFQNGQNIRLFYLGQPDPGKGRWRFCMMNNANTTYNVDLPLGMVWQANTWHMFTATYDGTKIKLFWDGALLTTQSASGSIQTNTSATYLGKSTSINSFYDGSIDDLKIFNVAYSDSEVNSLFGNSLH